MPLPFFTFLKKTFYYQKNLKILYCDYCNSSFTTKAHKRRHELHRCNDNPDIIDKAIEVFMDSDNATALRSVHKMSESSYKNFEITSDDYLIPLGAKYTNDISNNPRQSFPPTYTANGYIDILSTKFITNFDLIHGEKVIPFMTPLTLEIDTEEDFMMLEHVIALGLK